MMREIRAVVLSTVTGGGRRQNFLGASWVPTILRATPPKLRPYAALKLLGMSPHYFYGLVESEAERNRRSREQIARDLIARFVDSDSVVLDYGCGPGYLARAVASTVRRVDAVDISQGVIACAQVLNSAKNIDYMTVAKFERERMECEIYDFAYSIAVVQHCTDAVFRSILHDVRARMRQRSKIAFHLVIDGSGWRSEQEWKADRTFRGRIKLRYGLNCFTRNHDVAVSIARDAGFLNVHIVPMASFTSVADDVSGQHLLIAST
jgi:SAM-dependent methyltransferase